MTLHDEAVLVIGAGNYLTAPVGTALPLDLTAPEIAWSAIGHTDLDDILGVSSEGGEKTIIATLQNRQLRSKRSKRIDSFSVTLQQFDEAALKLYYGSNMVEVGAGELLGVPDEPVPTEAAFLAVFIDGDNHFAFYAPKVEILHGGDFEPGDDESPAGLPLSIQPLLHMENTWPYAVTPLAVTP